MEAYQKDGFWFSKIGDFKMCPRKYKLRHIDGLKVDEKSGDLEFGTAMHLGLNTLLEGGNGLEIFNIYWESLNHKDYQWGKFGWEACKDLARTFLTRFERLHLPHLKPYKMEERIHYLIDSVAWEGTPDFVGEYKGKRCILDFKTSGSKYDKRRIDTEEQLTLYSELAKHAWKYNAEELVYMVFVKDFKEPSIQVLKKELTSTAQSSTMLNMSETISDIKASKFPMNKNNCLMGARECPYFETCFGKRSKE